MFINRHKQANIVKNQKVFLKTISDLELYLVEFDLKKK